MFIKGTETRDVEIAVEKSEVLKLMRQMIGVRPDAYITNEGICHSEDHGVSHSYDVDVVDSTDERKIRAFRHLLKLEKYIEERE